MTSIVIDTSIAIKWIIGEEDSDDALMLRRLYTFEAPELLSAEAANAVLTHLRRGKLRPSEALAAAELLSQLSIVFHPLQPLIEDAVDLGMRLSHPAYDCMFLALAGRLNRPFVTADKSLIAKTSTLDMQVLSMREAIERAFAS